ncbi:MAG: homocysteine S-methyltransferase family protein [Ignavibacteriaceae bacterium]
MLSSDINIFSITRRTGRPLILDGAMGSLLQEKQKSKEALWMSYLNIENPGAVLKVHKDYIKAGADIITTNTFRTNPAAVKRNNEYSSRFIVKKALDIAVTAVKNTPVLIAGSNPPAEDCYQTERTLTFNKLFLNHSRHIKYLLKKGSHFILNETQSHFDEIRIICRFCSHNKIPFVISLYFDADLKILSGEKLGDVIKYILKYNPLAIGFNCIKPETFLKFFNRNKFDYNWGIYFNCGKGEVSGENLACGVSPEEYADYAKQFLLKSPSFIGACCGSSPQHINELKRVLDARIYN